MTDAGPSRRKFPRIPTKNAVLVHLLGEELDEELAKTRNISVGGCMFNSPKTFRVGSAIQLLVKIGEDVVEAVARVVYTQPHVEGGFDIGAEFVFINQSHKDKIFNLLQD